MNGRWLLAALTAALVLWAAAASPAQDASPPQPGAPPGEPHAEHEQPRSPDRSAETDRARQYFTDVVLVDQDGEPMRLYSDLLRGKTVVISPFFTSCTGVCPVLTGKLAAIQRRFADRLGKDLRLISISVDPETDTPERLKAYAERFNAGPGWYFVAGKKENVDWALYKLGQYVEEKEAHTNILIIGNETTGRWRKVFGLSPPEELIHAVEEVLDDGG